MCGIGGIISLNGEPIQELEKKLKVMNSLLAHRGPDGNGIWVNASRNAGFSHNRLAIIDLSIAASQPMVGEDGNVVVYNGEIYNYKELRSSLQDWKYISSSDTEVILAAYNKWGPECLNRFKGMFAFAIWDTSKDTLFCARDRFGIKPFYYAIVNGQFLFASEAKALVPFINGDIDYDAIKEYLYFQLYFDGKTLFSEIKELPPAHYITIKHGNVFINKYWEVFYEIDWYHTEKYFIERLRELLFNSVQYHTISDVPIGCYLSGGIDSSIVSLMTSKYLNYEIYCFHGKFSNSEEYDESRFAKKVAEKGKIRLFEVDIKPADFMENIRKIIYHLDFPVAGPGSFPQFIVSKLAARERKVVLGGQGGDEIFGGYTRYLIAYFEQCIKGAIEGTLKNGNFVVTYESIIPNLVCLRNYKSLLQEFWKEGLFDPMDLRYFRLINRAPNLKEEINWHVIGSYDPYESFSKIFNGSNVGKEAYFDKMTHFDFKTLLPALLQVEDRMSMAHGLESRVPLLDHEVVEFAATIPADIKFKNGEMKRLLKTAFSDILPTEVIQRRDKMGFPVPLNEWLNKELRNFLIDIFSLNITRDIFNKEKIVENINSESKFGRKIWGLLSLEIWYQEFVDKLLNFRKLIN